MDWFNGQAASRPAQYDNWTISVQREIRKGMTVELEYNGVYGSKLQAGLLNPNQVPMSVVNDLVARFGPTGARDLLNSQITSAAAVAAGITTAVCRTSPTPTCSVPGRWRKHCGRIRNTSR